MPTKRTLTRHLNEAREQIRRLVDARDDAQGEAGTEHFNTRRLAGQLSEAREEIEQLQRRLKDHPTTPAPAGWERERFQLRRDLALSERARAILDARVLELGQINQRMYAEQHDQAQGATS